MNTVVGFLYLTVRLSKGLTWDRVHPVFHVTLQVKPDHTSLTLVLPQKFYTMLMS